MDTDQALSIATIVGLATICVCGIVSVCYKTRPRSHMKISRSDPDLTTILDNSVPSASAKYIQPTLPDPEN
jgi:hypothetical protein